MKEKLNRDLGRITLRQLRALAALVRSGSTKASAEALHVTPPAITLQLRQLQASVGAPLIERREDGIVATAIGAEVLDAAERMEAALRDAAERIEALKGLAGGSVAVGVISTAKYFAPKALAAFAHDHPGIDIRLAVANREDTIRALRGFEFDLAVMGRPPQDFAVDQVAIGAHPHVIIAPPDHPLAGRADLALADIADQRFLLREPGSGTRSLLQDLFERAGARPHVGMEIGSNETIKQAVMAGLGIALISAHTIAAEIDDRRLLTLDVQGLPIIRQWFVVKRSEKTLSPAAEAMWSFLATRAKDFLPELA